MFGMVGHSNLGLADAIRRPGAAGEMHCIGVRHEGAAAFTASAYGKLSGRPAACLTIAGPAATHLLTGLWDAKVDRAPVLALTGQVQTQVFGPGAFQDIDLSSAFQAVTKFSHLVLPSSNPAERMSLACKTAIVERDVAPLIFLNDVQTLPSTAAAGAPTGRLGGSVVVPAEADLAQAVTKINAAKRPMIVIRHGAVAAREAVIARAEHIGIERSKPIIQLDFERMQLGRFHPVTLPIRGEIAAFCAAVVPRVSRPAEAADQNTERATRWAIWREQKRLRLAEDRGRGVHSAAVFETRTRLCPADAIIAVDVGNDTYSFGRYFESQGQRVLMSGYLGSIGFGFPAAMGAWAATCDFAEFKGRKVVSISGDGSFGPYAMEFTTAVKYGMDITHILLNNAELGKIAKEQRAGEFQTGRRLRRRAGLQGAGAGGNHDRP